MANPIKTNPNLTKQQEDILFNKGTEAPFTGQFLHNKDSGMYTCANCGAELFSSETKFDSGSGWPSFYDVASTGSVTVQEDHSDGTRRIEVMCATCGGHLGHVFDDAHDQPTGQRFCINGCVLDFKPDKKAP
jgi:peptide-methionine (R)-S-oxide reductase